jgi:long-subunit fatty acid transport protein
MITTSERLSVARVRRTSALAICLALSAGSVFAQSGQTAQIPLQFDFLDPGARSLGIGSAFVAVADDATAAFTNPAGLTFLVKPEVSAEFRYRRLDTPFLFGGRLNGAVTNTRGDTIAGPSYATSTDSSARPYFLSFVYPGKRWAVSAYRHELVRQDNSFQSNGAFVAAGQIAAQMAGLTGARHVSVETYGGALAYRLTERVLAGVGVAIYHFDLTTDSHQLGHDASGAAIPVAGASAVTQQGSGTSVAANLGLLFPVHPKLRLGVVFRQGLSFDFTQVDTYFGSPTDTGLGCLGCVATIPIAGPDPTPSPSLSPPRVRSLSGRFRTPQVFGLGALVKPMDNLSFSIDYDRVLYSRLKDDFISFQIREDLQNVVNIQDGNEMHVGAEYVFTRVAHTPGVRAGFWYDPDHSVHYTSDNTNSLQDLQLKAIFPGGESVLHYCFGFGVPVSPKFEVNMGADLAKNRRYVSASLVARFGK